MKVLAWLLFQVALLGTWLHATHVPLLRRILKYPRRAVASARSALTAGACRPKYHFARGSIPQQPEDSRLAGRSGRCTLVFSVAIIVSEQSIPRAEHYARPSGSFEGLVEALRFQW